MTEKVIVVQIGSRHRYLIPLLFERAGALKSFVTTSHGASALGRLVAALPDSFLRPAHIRLKGRNVKGIPKSKIKTVDSWTFIDPLIAKLKKINYLTYLVVKQYLWYRLISLRTKIAKGDVIYSLNGENLRFLKKARQQGARTIVDVFISPISHRILFEEKNRLGLAVSQEERDWEAYERYMHSVFKIADTLLCPSRWVAEGVCALDPSLAHKICICAYGSSLQPRAISENKRVPGRFFWAGGETHRKGLHYLAEASAILKSRYKDLEFVIAGVDRDKCQDIPAIENLHFVGKLNREQMCDYFASSTCFVFPTLTEGMASVIIEAISLGCPIITTREAGIDNLEDGKNGFIIPSRSTSAIVEKIDYVMNNQNSLKVVSDAALDLISEYSESAWLQRLEKLIEIKGVEIETNSAY